MPDILYADWLVQGDLDKEGYLQLRHALRRLHLHAEVLLRLQTQAVQWTMLKTI